MWFFFYFLENGFPCLPKVNLETAPNLAHNFQWISCQCLKNKIDRTIKSRFARSTLWNWQKICFSNTNVIFVVMLVNFTKPINMLCKKLLLRYKCYRNNLKLMGNLWNCYLQWEGQISSACCPNLLYT